MSYNKVILQGNLGRDPESKQAGELTIANFSIATTRKVKGENITDWHNCTAFGKTADTIMNYLKKGSSVLVEGQLNYDNYENKEGQKVTRAKIIVDRFTFTGGKKDDSDISVQEKTDLINSKSDQEEIPF